MHPILPSALRAATGLLAALLLGGCLSMSAPPAGPASPSLTKVDSARVTLWNISLGKKAGQVFLYGHVFRRYPAADEDTTHTHLAITLFNAGGERLRELTADFEPRQIPHGYRGPGYSAFAVPMDVLPEGTMRIQIQARDDLASDPARPVR